MCSVGGGLIPVEAVCSHLLPNPCSASIQKHASAHRPFSHPVISVSGGGPLDGNELTRKRPSGATSYWKPERLGATIRVWKQYAACLPSVRLVEADFHKLPIGRYIKDLSAIAAPAGL